MTSNGIWFGIPWSVKSWKANCRMWFYGQSWWTERVCGLYGPMVIQALILLLKLALIFHKDIKQLSQHLMKIQGKLEVAVPLLIQTNWVNKSMSINGANSFLDWRNSWEAHNIFRHWLGTSSPPMTRGYHLATMPNTELLHINADYPLLVNQCSPCNIIHCVLPQMSNCTFTVGL